MVFSNVVGAYVLLYLYFCGVTGQINSGYYILPSFFKAKAQRQLKVPEYRACPNSIKEIACVGIRCESRWGLGIALAELKENTVTC